MSFEYCRFFFPTRRPSSAVIKYITHIKTYAKKFAMDCSGSHRSGCWGIVPPHILEHLTRASGTNERQKNAASSTLQAMEAVHRARNAIGLTSFACPGGQSSMGNQSMMGRQSNMMGGQSNMKNRQSNLMGRQADMFGRQSNMMDRQSDSTGRQSGLIPPYMYAEISQSEDVSEETKIRIRLNMELANDMGMRSPSQGVEQSMPAVPAEPAMPEHLLRLVRDARQTNQKVGKFVVRNQQERNASRDEGAKRIWDYQEQIFKFFSQVYGRNSIDDKGFHLVATVHWDDDNGRTPGYMNAFWDPRMLEWYYGDGDGAIFDDFTKSLDISGHEYTHAVTQFTANLPYQYQAGALNEHFSDVFGSMIKQYFHEGGRQQAGDADWLIGQGIFLSAKAPALRSMKAPGTAYDWPEVIGTDPQPKDMDGYRELPLEKDNGGVHLFSGIPNRAFYLAATEFGGYAWDTAGKIWYETLVDPEFAAMFDPEAFGERDIDRNSKNAFKLMALLTCKHAQSLFGRRGFDVVKRAWKTVKVLPANNSML